MTRQQRRKQQRARQAWAYLTLKRGRVTVREVAGHLGCATSTAWDTLHRLCNEGYIERGGDHTWKVIIPLL